MNLLAKEVWTKRRRYLVGGLFVLALVGVFLFWPRVTAPITNYAECVAAGNPVLETYPPICRAGNQSFTGPTTTTIAEPTGTNVAFDILVNGDLGDITPRSSEAIHDQASWTAYWSHIHSHQKALPPLLPVDFTQSTVLAINEGPQATTGYVYRVTSVLQGTDTATVNITESVPTIGCAVVQKPTNRYFIVRADKLHGSVVFRTTVDHRHCDSSTGVSSDTVQ